MSLLDGITGYDEPPPPRTADERIRDAIIGLAEDLTSQDGYEIPARTLAALCPAIDELYRLSYFTDVMRWVVIRDARKVDQRTCDYNIDLTIDYLTGVR